MIVEAAVIVSYLYKHITYSVTLKRKLRSLSARKVNLTYNYENKISRSGHV